MEGGRGRKKMRAWHVKHHALWPSTARAYRGIPSSSVHQDVFQVCLHPFVFPFKESSRGDNDIKASYMDDPSAVIGSANVEPAKNKSDGFWG